MIFPILMVTAQSPVRRCRRLQVLANTKAKAKEVEGKTEGSGRKAGFVSEEPHRHLMKVGDFQDDIQMILPIIGTIFRFLKSLWIPHSHIQIVSEGSNGGQSNSPAVMVANSLVPWPPWPRKVEINEKREQFRPVATRGPSWKRFSGRIFCCLNLFDIGGKDGKGSRAGACWSTRKPFL